MTFNSPEFKSVSYSYKVVFSALGFQPGTEIAVYQAPLQGSILVKCLDVLILESNKPVHPFHLIHKLSLTL